MTGLGTDSIEGDRRLGGGQFSGGQFSGRAQHPAYRSSKKHAAPIRVQGQGFNTRESREKRTGTAKARAGAAVRRADSDADNGEEATRVVEGPATATNAAAFSFIVGR